ncbi:hypothetical protein WR25_00291 [Diploscapter pachys]|uniref:Palmitoyltransferase n=1 Tax=Diploscapter pachys TaxID=2018661 RepID=A0A2A2LNK3_9BILA|nr:hypothetical protein WR25_00291 [Diploscapter pachys]
MSESNGVEALEGSSSLPQASSTSSSSPLASTDAVSKAVDACQRGNLEVLEQLLFTGLSPNIVDQDGCSLLHWAAINNRVPIVRCLLEKGADPNAIGGLLVSTPLHWATRVGQLASTALLVQKGARADIRDAQGYAPIHLAVQGNHTHLIAYLLEKFDYCRDITDNSGMTPTMWCAYRSFSMFPMRLFVRGGANLNMKEHLQSNTAMHIAAAEKNVYAIRELIEGNADLSLRNNDKETPLDVARNQRNQTIIRLLEEAAREQHLLPMSFKQRIGRKINAKYIYALFPFLSLLSTFLLFTFTHWAVALSIISIAFLLLTLYIRFDFHSPKQSLVPIGTTASEPIFLVLTWSLYVHLYVPWWTQLLFLISIGVLFVSFLRVVFRNPGVVPRSSDHSHFVEEVESSRAHFNYCFTCWVPRQPHSKHCSSCDRCVKGFDHHCPWVHQCITRSNHRDFLLFVLSATLSSSIHVIACIVMLTGDIRDYGFGFALQENAWVVITMILSGFHSLALFALTCTQLDQISVRTTTNERIKSHRHAHGVGHSAHWSASSAMATAGNDSAMESGVHFVREPVTIGSRIRNLLEFCAHTE